MSIFKTIYCTVPKCKNKEKACGLCAKHYERKRVHGDVQAVKYYTVPTRKPQPKYRHVKTPEGTKLEHRLLAEKALGRKLPPGVVVHHMNGDGLDNHTPWNLVICPNQAYHRLLHDRTEALEKADDE